MKIPGQTHIDIRVQSVLTPVLLMVMQDLYSHNA